MESAETPEGEFDPGVISKKHPLKRIMTNNPFWRYISKHVPLPYIIAEFFFGAWMSCIAINLIGGFSEPSSPGLVLYAITAAYMVNVIWGLIDGWTYALGITMAGSEEDRAIEKLLIDRNDEHAKQKLIESLNDGPSRYLSYEEKEWVVETIVDSRPEVHPKKAYRLGRRDYSVVISFLMIDVLMATLTVIPFVIFSDTSIAMIASRLVTITAFACVAYIYAKYLNRNWVFWVALLSLLGVIIAQATWLYS